MPEAHHDSRLRRTAPNRPVWILLAAMALAVSLAAWSRAEVDFPPLKVDILNPAQKKVGQAKVYLNYVELTDAAGLPRGAIGVVMVEGRLQLFLVQADSDRKLIGWAEDHRLYNLQNRLVGYYAWTPLWSYVYDDHLKKVGQAECLAYQGVCAAGIAGYLLGLL